jgi:predicted nucleic acid-binding protein
MSTITGRRRRSGKSRRKGKEENSLGDKSSRGQVLVDTSVWIEFFKKGGDTGAALGSLIKTGRVVVAGVVLYEVLQGIKSEKEKRHVTALLSNLDYVEMSQDLWTSAGSLSQTLKGKGFNLPMSDILLAAMALKNNLSVFTLDSHFQHIPGIRLYK